MTTFACNADNRSLARTVFFVLQPEALRCSKMLGRPSGTSASGPIGATWPLLVSRQPAALDERVGCDGRPAARVHGVLRPVSGFWVDQVVRKVREEGSLETKTLLDGHPATAPLLGLMLQELRAVAFVEVDLAPKTFCVCLVGSRSSWRTATRSKVKPRSETARPWVVSFGRA